jgi:transcriptional regulator with XRE-family HTH domain
MPLAEREGNHVLTAEATRAARGLLGWTLQDLARASLVSFETLSRFENGRPMRESTARKIMAVFEAEGIELIAGEDRTGAVLVFARRAGG